MVFYFILTTIPPEILESIIESFEPMKAVEFSNDNVIIQVIPVEDLIIPVPSEGPAKKPFVTPESIILFHFIFGALIGLLEGSGMNTATAHNLYSV